MASVEKRRSQTNSPMAALASSLDFRSDTVLPPTVERLAVELYVRSIAGLVTAHGTLSSQLQPRDGQDGPTQCQPVLTPPPGPPTLATSPSVGIGQIACVVLPMVHQVEAHCRAMNTLKTAYQTPYVSLIF